MDVVYMMMIMMTMIIMMTDDDDDGDDDGDDDNSSYKRRSLVGCVEARQVELRKDVPSLIPHLNQPNCRSVQIYGISYFMRKFPVAACLLQRNVWATKIDEVMGNRTDSSSCKADEVGVDVEMSCYSSDSSSSSSSGCGNNSSGNRMDRLK
ncbi:hypothetical protein DINM_004017 [Dirofilaria immitis]|nr:hypothetical protein [Dirofilaria immitis]